MKRMEHLSISGTKTELDIQRKNDDLVIYANKYQYKLPKKNFLGLLKKLQDNILFEEGKYWFIEGKTFDEFVEKKQDKLRTKKVNGEERKYFNLISCMTVCEKNSRQFYYMTITAADTDGKG